MKISSPIGIAVEGLAFFIEGGWVVAWWSTCQSGLGKGGYYRIDKNEGRCKMNTFQYLLEVIMGAENPPVHW